jgi:ketosteroid isomerase-like protein
MLSAPLDTVALSRTLRQRAADYAAAVASNDVEAQLGFYTSDLVMLEPGVAVRGADSLRAFLAGGLQAVEVAAFHLVPERYVYGASLTTEFGSYTGVFRDRKAQSETTCDCRYAILWQRGDDGQWRIALVQAGLPK